MLLKFKATLCRSVWSKTSLAQFFVFHKQHFCLLGNIEVKSFIRLVVVNWNIYTIHARNLPDPAPVQIFFWHKHHICPMGIRKVHRLIGWLLWLVIYTQSARKQSTVPFFWFFFWNKSHLSSLRNREVQVAEGSWDDFLELLYVPNTWVQLISHQGANR